VNLWKQVPRDFERNLIYRIELREAAQYDTHFQAALLEACRQDVLFFMSAFCWVYEPRPKMVGGVKLPHIIPFIPWDHQVPVIQTIDKHLGFEDIGIEKSRGEGISWIADLFGVHDWLFEPLTAIGLVSRNEDAVDNPEDPDSLFWKIDWELDQLPHWMVPPKKRNLSEHTLRNLSNGSTITGYAATGDVASGGRKKWFLMDELAKFKRGADEDAMASTQHVTNSRLVVSTPKGADGAYYELMHQPSSMVRISLDWKDNPVRNRGLYQLVDGKPVALDAKNPLPADYHIKCKDVLSRLRRKGFKIEGTIRSPWYDHECDRAAATPQAIAQELDRDYGGSAYRVFGNEFFTRASDSVMRPLIVGEMDYNEETLEPDFSTKVDGPVQLWCALGPGNRPPKGQYVLGCDVATGSGGSWSSNSVVSVFDMRTNEQVMEFATNTMDPSDFADVCIAFAKWFHTGYLIWEINGPGNAFTTRVKERGYTNIYFRSIYSRRSKKKTQEIGWHTGDLTKEKMFSEFQAAVKSGDAVVRSEALSKECSQYIRVNGVIVHSAAQTTKDDSSKGKAHGDRCIAACVCLQGMKDRPVIKESSSDKKKNDRNDPPFNTMAARQKQYEDSRKSDDGWDARSMWDLSQVHSSHTEQSDWA
jgi:hypothetical protein